jgi:hypothetical protein
MDKGLSKDIKIPMSNYSWRDFGRHDRRNYAKQDTEDTE